MTNILKQIEEKRKELQEFERLAKKYLMPESKDEKSTASTRGGNRMHKYPETMDNMIKRIMDENILNGGMTVLTVAKLINKRFNAEVHIPSVYASLQKMKSNKVLKRVNDLYYREN